MTLVELNFDGLIGPSHNYAGLSLGNVASARNQGGTARPRDAALQGLAKMKRLMDLGLPQGFLPPHERPYRAGLRAFGFSGSDAAMCAAAWAADPGLLANLCSASSMWTANAATVSPAPDTRDGRTHLSVANLSAMPHRSFEAAETERLLRLAFADTDRFVVHSAVPPGHYFGDEGAANHGRLAPRPDAPGVELFVYGEDSGGRFPARQTRQASEAVARRHGLDPERTVFARQADEAVQAGAFHNDVVSVANAHVLFTHQQAFQDRAGLYEVLAAKVPGLQIIEAPAAQVSLADAITSYLFNSQLVSLPAGGMALVLPQECQENPAVWRWLESLLASGGPITERIVMDVRESMRNGGGPACLRLRVQLSADDLARVDPRFLLDARKWEDLCRLVEAHWPETIAPADLGTPDCWQACWTARDALFDYLGLPAG